jgi:uncharacterized protein with PIN domain
MKDHRSRDEIRAELLSNAESLIDEILDWDDRTEAPTLRDIEREVLKLRKQFGQSMTGAVIERQEQRRPVPGPRCPECGAAMQYKDMKETRVEGQVGDLEIERGYYYCAGCRRGLFPPG